MIYIKHGWMWLMISVLVIASQGCQRSEDAGERKPKLSDSKILQPKTEPKPPPAPVVTQPPVVATPVTPPSKPAIPQVALSAEQLATCLVKVGDRMPDAELPDVDGKQHSIFSLLGRKLTVVFFWTADNPYSLGEVHDLNDDVAKAYASRGVNVIGIHHGNANREKIKALGVEFPILMDATNDYFAKVATAKPLRTYLLDADGKILWFDVEYSRSTRRDLLQAIDAVL